MISYESPKSFFTSADASYPDILSQTASRLSDDLKRSFVADQARTAFLAARTAASFFAGSETLTLSAISE